MAERERGVAEEMENFPQRILNAMTYTLDFLSVGSKESVKGFKGSMSPGKRIEYGAVLHGRKYQKEEQFPGEVVVAGIW